MRVNSRLSWVLVAVLIGTFVTGCGLLPSAALDGAPAAVMTPNVEQDAKMTPGSAGDQFPDVLAVELRPQADGSYELAVTLSSPYDSAQRYADGWRVLDAQGNTLGAHTLLHDHAAEQPFTRLQRGLVIPADVLEVTVEGRDQLNGYGGATLSVPVPER